MQQPAAAGAAATTAWRVKEFECAWKEFECAQATTAGSGVRLPSCGWRGVR